MSERVFVYGTLRRGQRNHALLGSGRLLGPFITRPLYTMLDLGAYPAVVPGGSTAVTGEVYAVDAQILASLDRLEGYPRLYTREILETPYGNAWLYIYLGSPAGRRSIGAGDWVRR